MPSNFLSGLFGGLAGATKQGKKFLFGSKEKHKRVPTLLPEQQGLFDQLTAAGLDPGAGGAFGTAADYYRNLLSDDPADFDAMAAPEMRRFNEEIIPGLSEQFAGMGSGGLSSSGFRNAAVSAGTDLSERLGALRAQLRQQGAQGLAGIGQLGLGNFSQDVITQPGTPGFLGQIAPAVGQAAAAYAGVPSGGMPKAQSGQGFNWVSNKGKSSPYGTGDFRDVTFMGR